VNRGVIEASPFQMPGHPVTSIIGLIFLASIVVGLAITGWQSSPSFWHKTTFIVVVVGIPVIAAVLAAGWFLVRPKVIESTNGKIKALWSNTGPTYPPPPRSDEELYQDQTGVFGYTFVRRPRSGSTRMNVRSGSTRVD
jgi:L-asparagine permease